MNELFTFFAFLGSITSILAFLLSIIKKDKLRNIMFYLAIAVLCGIASWSFHLYKRETDKELIREKREQKARMEAKAILDSSPSYISYSDSGENMGVITSVLIFLDKYKDIWPNAYEDYKKNKEELYEDPGLYEFTNKDKIQMAGQEALQVLKSLAQ